MNFDINFLWQPLSFPFVIFLLLPPFYASFSTVELGSQDMPNKLILAFAVHFNLIYTKTFCTLIKAIKAIKAIEVFGKLPDAITIIISFVIEVFQIPSFSFSEEQTLKQMISLRRH